MTPYLSIARRNALSKIGIALQIAIVLAVVANASFIVMKRVQSANRNTGVNNEQSLLVVTNDWTDTSHATPERVAADLAAIRAISGVVDASVTNTYPLSKDAWGFGITLKPGEPRAGAPAAAYFGDEHLVRTLGLKLSAGRELRQNDVVNRRGLEDYVPSLSGVLVTQQLAKTLGGNKSVLGEVATLLPERTTVPIVGIIDEVRAPVDYPFPDNAIILPYLLAAQQVTYLVRTNNQDMTLLRKALEQTLFSLDSSRVLEKMETMQQARNDVYRTDRGLAIMLSCIGILVLAITSCGIVGLAGYWVTKRQRDIGILRALGASRAGIISELHIENLIVTGFGVVLGILLSFAGSIWLSKHMETERVSSLFVYVGAGIMVVLGQLSILSSSLRAANTAPMNAIRSQ